MIKISLKTMKKDLKLSKYSLSSWIVERCGIVKISIIPKMTENSMQISNLIILFLKPYKIIQKLIRKNTHSRQFLQRIVR